MCRLVSLFLLFFCLTILSSAEGQYFKLFFQDIKHNQQQLILSPVSIGLDHVSVSGTNTGYEAVDTIVTFISINQLTSMPEIAFLFDSPRACSPSTNCDGDGYNILLDISIYDTNNNNNNKNNNNNNNCGLNLINNSSYPSPYSSSPYTSPSSCCGFIDITANSNCISSTSSTSSSSLSLSFVNSPLPLRPASFNNGSVFGLPTVGSYCVDISYPVLSSSPSLSRFAAGILFYTFLTQDDNGQIHNITLDRHDTQPEFTICLVNNNNNMNANCSISNSPLTVNSVSLACSSYSNCGDCQDDILCGWCTQSATCTARTSTSCSSSLLLTTDNCPSCSSLSACAACSTTPGCAWCLSSSQCLSTSVGMSTCASSYNASCLLVPYVSQVPSLLSPPVTCGTVSPVALLSCASFLSDAATSYVTHDYFEFQPCGPDNVTQCVPTPWQVVSSSPLSLSPSSSSSYLLSGSLTSITGSSQDASLPSSPTVGSLHVYTNYTDVPPLWSSLTMSTAILGDGGYVGVSVRYTSFMSEQYVFEWGSTELHACASSVNVGGARSNMRTQRLKKRTQGGAFVVLDARQIGYDTASAYNVQLQIVELSQLNAYNSASGSDGTLIIVTIDGNIALTAIDTDVARPRTGTVALLTAGGVRTYFSNMIVVPFVQTLALSATTTTNVINAAYWSHYNVPVQAGSGMNNSTTMVVTVVQLQPMMTTSTLTSANVYALVNSSFYPSSSPPLNSIPSTVADDTIISLIFSSSSSIVSVYNPLYASHLGYTLSASVFAVNVLSLNVPLTLTTVLGVALMRVDIPSSLSGDPFTFDALSVTVSRLDATSNLAVSNMDVFVQVSTLPVFQYTNTVGSSVSASSVVINTPLVSAGQSYYVAVYMRTNSVSATTAAALVNNVNLRVTASVSKPIVTNYVPTAQAPYILLSIYGSNFGPQGTVTVGSYSCSVTSWSSSFIICALTPSQGTNLLITVSTLSQTSVDLVYYSFSSPVFSSSSNYIQPSHAPTSAQMSLNGNNATNVVLTIYGQHFGNNPALLSVSVGANPCPLVSASDISITCLLPPGTGLSLPVSISALLGGSSTTTTAPGAFSYDTPVVSAIYPANGPTTGTVITVTGNNFGKSPIVSVSVNLSATNEQPLPCDVRYTYVLVGGLLCAPVSGGPRSDTVITCLVPSSTGLSVPVQVCVLGLSYTFTGFSYDLPVVISALSSSSSSSSSSSLTVPAVGAIVTILGYNFGPPSTSTAPTVRVSNGLTTFTPLYINSTAITFNLPAGVGQIILRVSLGNLLSPTSVSLSYASPIISNISPNTGLSTLSSTNVTVTGANFGPSLAIADAPLIFLTFLASSSSRPMQECSLIQLVSDAMFVVSVPPMTGAQLSLVYSRGGGVSASNVAASWLSYAAPILLSASPTIAAAATLVTLSGANFGVSIEDVTVTFTVQSSSSSLIQVNAPVQFVSASSIVVSAPVSSGENTVSVTVAGQTSSPTPAVLLNYPAPIITSVTPLSASTTGTQAQTGVSITITVIGAHFGSGGVVMIGAQTCAPILSYTDTMVLCVTPAGDGVRAVQVLTNAGSNATFSQMFVYAPPQLISVQPSSSSSSLAAAVVNGVAVTVVGSNFGTGMAGPYSLTLSAACVTMTAVSLTSSSSLSTTTTTTTTPTTSMISYSNGYVTLKGGWTTATDQPGFTGSQYASDVTTAAHGSATFSPDLPFTGFYTVSIRVHSSSAISSISVSSLSSPSPLSVPVPSSSSSSSSSFPSWNWLTLGGTFNFGFGPNNAAVTIVGGGVTPLLIDAVQFCPSSSSSSSSSSVFSSLSVMASSWSQTSISASLPPLIGTYILSAAVGTQLSSPPLTVSSSPPTLLSVNGCANVASGCNPLGSDVLTITGTVFMSASSSSSANVVTTVAVYVGSGRSYSCVVSAVTSTTITCASPAYPSGGANVPLTVCVFGVCVSSSSSSTSFGLTYSSTPILSSDTIRLSCGASPSTSVAPSTSVSIASALTATEVCIDGVFAPSPSSVSVAFGVVSTTNAQTPTLSPSFPCTFLSITATRVRCTTIEGGGVHLSLIVTVNGVSSLASSDVINYPAPSIVPGTIRGSVNATTGSTTYQNVNVGGQQGEWIYFNVRNVPRVLASSQNIAVTFSSATDPTVRICSSPQVFYPSAPPNLYFSNPSDPTMSCLRCFTGFGSGGGFVFTVTVANSASAPGTDQYSYPSSSSSSPPLVNPLISQVSGCGASVSGGAVNCSTSGGSVLTISGMGFCASTATTCVQQVLAGSYACVLASASSTTQILCTLPAGSGINLPVIIIQNQLIVQAQQSVSYALATVAGVSGCPATGCVYMYVPAQTITVTGTNFGPMKAIVMIGGQMCSNTVHSSASPQTLLTCTLPPLTSSLITQTSSPSTVSAAIQVIPYLSVPSGSVYVLYALCAPGSYVANNTVCVTCPQNTYSTVYGATQCSVCPSGKSAASGSSSCLACLAGTYSLNLPSSLLGSSCLNCSAGFFSSLGSSICLPCPVGSYSGAPASPSCLPCKPGQFAPGQGNTACLACPSGTTSTSFDGSPLLDRCDPCPVGTSGTGGTCSPCAAGSFNSLVGQSSCSQCPFGTAASVAGMSTCLSCDRGYFSNTPGSSSCSPCDLGRYSSALGATTCPNCTAGTYSATTASPFCTSCEAGSFSGINGSTTCSSCLAGSFSSSSGQSSCLPCSAGSSTSGQSAPVISCPLCAAGTFSDSAGASVCTACAPGFVAPLSGMRACTSCPPGTTGIPVGHVGGSLSCVPCAAGTFSSVWNASSACTMCAVGTAANMGGATTCVACAPGQYQAAVGQSTCLQCGVGTAVNITGATSCDACAAGSYALNTGSSTCSFCVPGTIAFTSGQSVCSSCQPGTFSNAFNQTSCSSCSAGSFQPLSHQSSCLVCGIGTFSSQQQQSSCTQCQPGEVSSMNATTCVTCAPGQFQSSTQLDTCLNCPPGTFSVTSGSSFCSACPAGTYSNVSGSTFCVPCLAGTSSVSPSSFCYNCLPGYFSSSDGSPTCSSCPVGRYVSAFNATTCLACNAGRFAQYNGMPSCELCPMGTFALGTGYSQCQLCPLGTAMSQTGAVSCTKCVAGSFSNVQGATSCASCPVGRFNQATAQSQCSSCNVGQFSNMTGLSECMNCAPGTYMSATGQTMCAPCPAGQFAVTPSSSICQNCGVGTFSNVTGASMCVSCQGGSYNAKGGVSVCELCSPGTFSSSGATGCSQCTGNNIAVTAGQSACKPCVSDSQPNMLYTECECPSGQYFGVDDTGGFSCIACPPGGDCTNRPVVLTSILALNGWWRVNNVSTDFERCILPQMCVNNGCANYRTGPLCALCVDNTREDTSNNCVPCTTGSVNYVSVVLIICAIIFALCVMYYLVLWSDRTLVRIVELIDLHLIAESASLKKLLEQIKQNRNARRSQAGERWHEQYSGEVGEPAVLDVINANALFTSSGFNGNSTGNSSRLPGIISQEAVDSLAAQSIDIDIDELYRPIEKPNLTYKIKIVVGFFQICTNLTFALNIPWPTHFLSFISIFNVFNMNFLQWSSVNCVTFVNFYWKMVAESVIPLLVVLAIYLLYWLPQRIMYREDTPLHAAHRRRSNDKTIKLVLFTLFLVFPQVSSTVLSMYVCRQVGDHSYLVSDFSIFCHDSTWYAFLPFNVVMILVYPIGIPLFFFQQLYHSRHSFSDKHVILRLGFLFDGYSHGAWYFELLDMLHKLMLTSLLAFFPITWQMPVGMVVVIAYAIVILLRCPYFRKGDDRLHLLAQVEILLLILAGLIFYDGNGLDDKSDWAMSIFLIIVITGFVAVFFAQTVYIFKKVLFNVFCTRSSSSSALTGLKQHDRERARMQKELGIDKFVEEMSLDKDDYETKSVNNRHAAKYQIGESQSQSQSQQQMQMQMQMHSKESVSASHQATIEMRSLRPLGSAASSSSLTPPPPAGSSPSDGHGLGTSGGNTTGSLAGVSGQHSQHSRVTDSAFMQRNPIFSAQKPNFEPISAPSSKKQQLLKLLEENTIATNYTANTNTIAASSSSSSSSLPSSSSATPGATHHLHASSDHDVAPVTPSTPFQHETSANPLHGSSEEF